MAMARDGLLPSFFSDVNRHTRVPVKSTIVTGICAGTLAFFMEVSQLAGMVSVGTLLAFTMVAISVLILRYVPPDEIPLPLSVHGSLEYASISSNCSKEIEADKQTDHIGSSKDMALAAVDHPLLLKQVGVSEGSLNEDNRRKIAGWTITVICVGVVTLTWFVSVAGVPSYLRFSLCGIGAVLIVSGLVILSCIDQDDARHSFGHAGGFTCPFVPFLPVACILVNCYLMVNLGTATWIRVSVWLLMGVFIYAFYGRNHSTLQDAIYVPAAHADEIYRISRKDTA
uniref:Cationic amino acid transporter C-terminal domain-containing protein n=1 Tax=Kalanchoe fedtschenkoi TaxID=63787 RepID=A0A7N0VJI5_KALFE